MTLSNFDWTDKDSVKWFILLPTGHEGPYSLDHLTHLKTIGKLSAAVKIWTEGLNDAVSLKQAIDLVEQARAQSLAVILPPLPEEEIPPLPSQSTPSAIPEPIVEPAFSSALKPWMIFLALIVACGFVGLQALISEREVVTVHRLSRMSPGMFERIQRENVFGGWDKKVFFKEYVPEDHSGVWLVTSSFQTCQVEATFTSLKDKLLTLEDEKVSFKSRAQLKDHIVDFSKLEFSQGKRLIPGLYEMDVRATDCRWDGLLPNLMNNFSGPEPDYVGRTKVILYSKGAGDFNQTLDRLLLKKMESAQREQNQNELFWQDLEQKFETLQAITLQIEQHFLDFLSLTPVTFKKNLGPMVSAYTKKFGTFLTSFVVENENYFRSLDLKGNAKKATYEIQVRQASKRIGLESMKFIEEFQGLKKNPTAKEIALYENRIKKVFSGLKSDLSSRLEQVSSDQGR